MPPNTSSVESKPSIDEVQKVPKKFTDDELKYVPEKVPTLVELKRILPKHCFESNAIRSLSYAFKDLFIISVNYALILLLSKYFAQYTIIQTVIWPIYWFFQGTMFWALFVIAHDCGHESFSNSTLLNNIVGNILNTFILVPFYAWKLSHKHHHRNTGNIDKDEIFYPTRTEFVDQKSIDESQKTKVRKTRFIPYWGFGLSWFIYLFRGYGSNDRKFPHFNPFDSFFRGHVVNVGISVLCITAWVSIALPAYAAHFGFNQLVAHYLIPVFVFASWLVVVTFLHHQEVNVPWYSDDKWDFVRGNLSSVDRHYGWAHNLTHNIGTHQIHHLFIKIPHYHLEEATAVFRQHYPNLVRISDESIMGAFDRLYHIFTSQQDIPKDVKIHVYKEIHQDKKIQ